MDIASQIQSATETLQNLRNLSGSAPVIPYGEYIVPFLLVLSYFVKLVNKGFFLQMLGLLEYKEKKRLEHINEYLSSDCTADPETAKIVRDLRDAHYFKVATGIYAEDRTRKALIKLHQETSHNILWKHIDRAKMYMSIDQDGKVTVCDLTLLEKIHYWFTGCAGWGSVTYGFYLMLVLLASAETKSWALFGLSVGCLLFFAIFAVFILSNNLPYHARKLIADELERLRACSSEG